MTTSSHEENVSRLRHSPPIALTEEDPTGGELPIGEEYSPEPINPVGSKATHRRGSVKMTGRWSWRVLLLFDEEEKVRSCENSAPFCRNVWVTWAGLLSSWQVDLPSTRYNLQLKNDDTPSIPVFLHVPALATTTGQNELKLSFAARVPRRCSVYTRRTVQVVPLVIPG